MRMVERKQVANRRLETTKSLQHNTSQVITSQYNTRSSQDDYSSSQLLLLLYCTVATYTESILDKFVVIKDIWSFINNACLVGRGTDIFQNEISFGTSNHFAFLSSRVE